MNYLILVALIAVAVVIVMVRRPHLWRDVKDEFDAAVSKAKDDVEWGKRDPRDPVGEAMTDQEAEQLVEAYYSLTRPALLLRADPGTEALQAPARLGGQVWFADDEEWPRGRDGEKLEFVAQYDLSRLPPLEGFPAEGVARFFVGRDDIWGVNFDLPDDSDVKVLWHDGPPVGGRLEKPMPWGEEEYSPFESESVRSDGLALRPEPVNDLPDYYSWQLQERIDHFAGRPGLDVVEDKLMEINETREFAHRIGGHPSFTQYDFRKRGANDDFDILLLGVSSDESIMWGDVGEAGFYIRRADLDRRDFSRVAFYWDCH